MKGGWFVTGTDTGVGKTAVTEGLLRAFARRDERAVGMKPVATGGHGTGNAFRAEDVERLIAASSVPVTDQDINCYAFEPAIAPHFAAVRAGVAMELSQIDRQFAALSGRADWILVEGAGGWYVPLDEASSLAEVPRRLKLPVIVVVGIKLGCINHALLTVRAIAADGVRLAGWVANRIDPTFDTADETVAALRRRLPTPCLADVPYGSTTLAGESFDSALEVLIGKRS